MKEVGEFFVGLVFIALSVITGGFVFMKMWNWLIAEPLNIETISYGSGVALSLFLSYTKIRVKDADDEEKGVEVMAKRFFKGLALSGIFLFIGWIVSLCI